MGYYYDWLNEQWVDKSTVTPRFPKRLRPRRTLVDGLIKEMEQGDSEVQLYAGLLVRRLIVGDPSLMQEFGKQVAAMSRDQNPTSR
jgi:hypothetical protein